MKPLPHIYSAQLAGGPDGYATVAQRDCPEFVSRRRLTSTGRAMHGAPSIC